MHTRLVPIGNSFGVRLPQSIIKQLNLDKNNLEIAVKDGSLVITPISDVPPLTDWDRLFEEAKKKGFNAEEDAKDFLDWDITINDGLD